MNKKLVILYDNTLYNQNLKSGWGFSCLVVYLKNVVMFDTGADSETLLYNMKYFNINPAIINSIVISHMHYDHTGGLKGLLSYKNKNVYIYLPSSALHRDIKSLEYLGVSSHNIKIIRGPQKIADNIFSTGSLGGYIKEQSLVINTERGLIIVTGCAHPGITYIINTSIKLFRNTPLFVIGGFHLFNKSKKEILKIIEQFKKLNVKYVSPCHCSGEKARELFKKEYSNHYIEGGVGKEINIDYLK